MGKKWSLVFAENPVLAARIAAHKRHRAALDELEAVEEECAKQETETTGYAEKVARSTRGDTPGLTLDDVGGTDAGTSSRMYDYQGTLARSNRRTKD